MRKHLLVTGLALLLSAPAFAEGEAPTGALVGAGAGAIIAGPPGALIGAVIGGTAGAVTESARYKYSSGDIVVGTALPAQGVVYKPVPANYYVATVPQNRRNYIYTVVDDAGPNDRVVVVDPQTHTVVQVLQ